MRENGASRAVVPCICQRARRIKSELPPRFHEARLTDFPTAIVDFVTAWLAKPGDGLLLQGPAGTGKTHLAAAIIRARIEAGRRAIFRRAADLYAGLRQSYQGSGTEEALLREYTEAPLLVLDDLGAGALTDFERRSTLEALDRRLNALLPTVVTTNLTLRDMEARLDDRIASRLSGLTKLELTGRDQRVVKK